MKTDTKEIRWLKNGKSQFETFAMELADCTNGTALPNSATQDVKYGIELQKERHKKMGIHMKYHFVPQGYFAEKCPKIQSWCDDKYINYLEFRSCQFTKTFYLNGQKCLKRKQDSTFYQTITHAKNPQLLASEPYNCPNCGAVSSIQDLQNGCAHCDAHFDMDDIFPKITNYYILEEPGGSPEHLKQSLKRTMLLFIFVYAIFVIPHYYHNDASLAGNLVLSIILGSIASIIGGTVTGYMFFAFFSLGKLFFKAFQSLPMLFHWFGSSYRFMHKMKKYSSEFTYEYFTGKVVALLKLLLYTEDASKLPIYDGTPLGERFHSIVEASYVGAVALKNFKIKNDYAYVTVYVYMDNIYKKKNKLRSKNTSYRMKLYKNLAKPIDYNFSITKITCHSCGASYDATKNNTCPYCNSIMELCDEDWIVSELKER